MVYLRMVKTNDKQWNTMDEDAIMISPDESSIVNFQ